MAGELQQTLARKQPGIAIRLPQGSVAFKKKNPRKFAVRFLRDCQANFQKEFTQSLKLSIDWIHFFYRDRAS